MKRVRSLAFGTAVAAVLVVGTGCNECDFFERCEGNVRQVCGQGVDQQFNRKIESTACVVPNEVCAEIGVGTAVCARVPVTECDTEFVAHCEGGMVLSCSPRSKGVVVAQECTRVGQRCGINEYGQAACVGK